MRYLVKAYDYFCDPIDTKGTFLALRYNPDAVIRCVDEFKNRWNYPYVLIIEEKL